MGDRDTIALHNYLIVIRAGEMVVAYNI